MSKHFWKAFNESNGRCVYCLKDLMLSFDDFSQSVEDHLVPKAFDGPVNDPSNIVIACAVCNAIKHHKSPTDQPFDPLMRATYIRAAREQISQARQKKFEDYEWWVSRFATRFIPTEEQ